MKPVHREILIVVVCLILGFALSKTILQYVPTNKYINCSLAEISPDFTTEMKNHCRNLRSDAATK
jgi:hypothetical protein